MVSAAAEEAAAGVMMEGEAEADLSDGGSSTCSGEELEQLDFGDSDDWGGEATADEGEEEETDPARLLQRQKQVDFGKNTIGYERYVVAVPKDFRKRRGRDTDPPTPDIKKKMTKRTWDGIVKVWRRHLHKYEAMDQAEAEAHAEQLKGRVLAVRKAKGQAKAAATAEARAAEKSKSKAGAAAGQEKVSRAEKKRRRLLAAQARQQRQQEQPQQQRGQGLWRAELPLAPKPQHASTDPSQEQPAQHPLAEPHQQQQNGSREWGSADKQQGHGSRSARPDNRQSYGRGDRDREVDREGRSAGAYGSSRGSRDRERDRGYGRDRRSPSRDRQQREWEREAGRSSRDGRSYGASGRQADSSYSRRSRDDDRCKAGRSDDSRRDRAAAADRERDRDSSRQQFKWQVVEDRAGWPTRSSSDKENSRGGYGGSSRGATAGEDDTHFYDRSFGSRSSKANRAEQSGAAAAAVAAAVKGLDTLNTSSSRARGQSQQQQQQPAGKPASTTPLASRRYSSLRQQLAASGSDSEDAPSPLRRQPASLLGEDCAMDWADGTPSCPHRASRCRGGAHGSSWADDVEAAEALSNVCEVMMVMGTAPSPLAAAAAAPGSRFAAAAAAADGHSCRQGSMELEEGEIGGDDENDLAAAAGGGGQQDGNGGGNGAVRPRSAGVKRTAACLG